MNLAVGGSTRCLMNRAGPWPALLSSARDFFQKETTMKVTIEEMLEVFKQPTVLRNAYQAEQERQLLKSCGCAPNGWQEKQPPVRRDDVSGPKHFCHITIKREITCKHLSSDDRQALNTLSTALRPFEEIGKEKAIPMPLSLIHDFDHDRDLAREDGVGARKAGRHVAGLYDSPAR